MANCADCHQPFAGTPWRYNTAGARVHCDCNEQPPDGPRGSPGDAHHTKPRPAWHRHGKALAQIRWRQIAADHAPHNRFAASVHRQHYPITPAQGAVLDRLQRQRA